MPPSWQRIRSHIFVSPLHSKGGSQPLTVQPTAAHAAPAAAAVTTASVGLLLDCAHVLALPVIGSRLQ